MMINGEPAYICKHECPGSVWIDGLDRFVCDNPDHEEQAIDWKSIERAESGYPQ